MLSSSRKLVNGLGVNCLSRGMTRRLAGGMAQAEKDKYLSLKPYVLPGHRKIVSPPMVYISGEEMTKYTMDIILEEWVKPHIDASKWEVYDLSCKNRDATDDKVLKDAVEAGKRVGSIFKEPTITPSAQQVKEMGLKKAYGSPNGAMRRGWNGYTISRDTIHIDGVKLGFEKPVFFERHAVGGKYHSLLNRPTIHCCSATLIYRRVRGGLEVCRRGSPGNDLLPG